MNFKRLVTTAIFLASFLAGVGQASARVFAIEYWGGQDWGKVQFTGNLQNAGAYSLTLLGGVANGSEILSLSSFSYPLDQISDSIKAILAFGGISFSAENGTLYYLDYRGGSFMLSVQVDSNGNYLGEAPTVVNVGVPELATWAMTLAGFASLGLASHCRIAKTVRS